MATRRPNGANNPGFVAHLKERSGNRKVVIALIHELMLDQAQPLTIAEMRELAVQAGLHGGYRVFDMNLVRQFATLLVTEGKLFTRTDTDAERLVRSGGKQTSGLNAALYSASNPVPARTVTMAVAGVLLPGIDERQPRKPKSRKRGRPKGSLNRPKLADGGLVPTRQLAERFAEAGLPSAPWVTADASTVDLLAAVDKIVADRTAGLAARLRDAEARAELAETRLAQIRDAIAG